MILVHGLWMPGIVMTPLAARLARAGYRCHLFHYPSHRRTLEANVERLLGFVRRRVAERPAHYIGHSLGGLVVLRALLAHGGLAARSVLLLGTPAQGCLAGRLLGQRKLGRWLLGASEPLWSIAPIAKWTRPEPLGVVAGTVPVGLARTMIRLPGPNDGVVRVEETFVEGMAARIVLPVAHSAMIVSRRVARQAIAFLAHGCFEAA